LEAPGERARTPAAPVRTDEGRPPGPPPRRRGRAIALVVGVGVVMFVAATARLLIWPAQGMPRKVSAIVLMAGPGNLLSRAVKLAREHRAPFLVVSLGRPGSGNQCPARIPRVMIVCFNPVPASTQGEAELVGRLARRHHWRSVALVTIIPQDTRARLRVERCFPGRVYVVTAPPAPSQTSWPYQIAYQWAALVKALVFQRSC
jgi:hypothetical protein